jgi:hypothetical protein
LNRRHRHHAAVEDDGHRPTDVRFRESPEPHGGVLLQRKVDRRPVELVERLLRVAKVVARDGRHFLDDINGRTGRPAGPRPLALSWKHLVVRRQVVVEGLQRRFARRERPLVDQAQLQPRRRPDDLFGAANIAHTWQLHENLVPRAIPGHDGFGDAQFVDSTFDRLERLRDRLIAKLVGHVRLHPIRVATGF